MRLCVDFHVKSILYLVFNNMGHGRKFKQKRLCTDFNARPSKE